MEPGVVIEKYNGTFTGSDLGIFEIDIELDFTSTENNDLIMGSTNNDVIGNGVMILMSEQVTIRLMGIG